MAQAAPPLPPPLPSCQLKPAQYDIRMVQPMWVLHDWNDGLCIKILKQCKKGIPHDDGKVIIVDAVLQSNVTEDAWEDAKMVFDVTMIAHTSGGKERTEVEWRKLLKDGGFNSCNIIALPTIEPIPSCTGTQVPAGCLAKENPPFGATSLVDLCVEAYIH
ncbi:hypothetical protein EJ110_NYTH21412 [Nymphaea thermarum]|nr:hypothetical protein EJ110_NYTH21412 [Nymphaea thermarum]